MIYSIHKQKFQAIPFTEQDALHGLQQLACSGSLPEDQLFSFINWFTRHHELDEELFSKARSAAQKHYGSNVYIRGLIEFTSYCKNDCLYCGIRKSNVKAQRYRLTEKEILSCCETGYELGFRTFVLQGGDDGYFTDTRLERLIYSIKNRFPHCALTLSAGEKSGEAYRNFYRAGADRYLLRHETASQKHYQQLHPSAMSWEHRIQCLAALKDIGFQVGAGFMVGSPFQTIETITQDLLFLKELEPHMIGIGPFIPHRDTPLGTRQAGSLSLTLKLLAVLRLMHKDVLLPATTALGTIASNGRQLGLLAGANVIMPNLSPGSVREKYTLYNNKLCTGCEAAEGLASLKKEVEAVGYTIQVDRGDHPLKQQKGQKYV